jgi:uncharacterized membrane protein YkvI
LQDTTSDLVLRQGVEALQFFGAWGGKFAFLGNALALLTSIVVLIAVYVTGFEQHFEKSSEVYHYFCGKHFGIVLDYYIYVSMICVTLIMMSGAGATISQYSGLPAFVGASLMGVLCIITALLGLERLRKALSYMCVFIILFVLFCGGYAIFTSDFTSVLSKHSTPRAELIVPTNLTPRPLDLSDYRGLLVVL